MDNSPPNPDLVGDLFWGIFKPQWIRLALTLWANGGGTAHSFETYKSWLEEIGFQRIESLSERWLAARK
ncbi:MAG: hypothetical protein IT315_01060 [Anaerolineales bacterium]|nr:hypothetical protein [Anaerolineales bacterium]